MASNGITRTSRGFSFYLSFLSSRRVPTKLRDCKTSSFGYDKFPTSPVAMDRTDIALTLAGVSIVVAILALLCQVFPVKEWIRYRFPRLWPPPDRYEAITPAKLESGLGGAKSATADKATQTAPAVKPPSLPSLEFGPRFELRFRQGGGDNDSLARGGNVCESVDRFV